MKEENRQTESRRDETASEGKSGAGPKKKPGLLKVIQSILAGALGVQSSRRHEEDFESGSPWHYIVGGIIFGAIFVVTLILIVRWVLASQ
ncbi:DUF2970 domain-containing protein [Marinobacter sp.]|uniref:DUF2970 domain-containing protein n=1 Tax=Marinobacter sp. TaxID=50741 RepID=UPI00384A5D20